MLLWLLQAQDFRWIDLPWNAIAITMSLQLFRNTGHIIRREFYQFLFCSPTQITRVFKWELFKWMTSRNSINTSLNHILKKSLSYPTHNISRPYTPTTLTQSTYHLFVFHSHTHSPPIDIIPASTKNPYPSLSTPIITIQTPIPTAILVRNDHQHQYSRTHKNISMNKHDTQRATNLYTHHHTNHPCISPSPPKKKKTHAKKIPISAPSQPAQRPTDRPQKRHTRIKSTTERVVQAHLPHPSLIS